MLLTQVINRSRWLTKREAVRDVIKHNLMGYSSNRYYNIERMNYPEVMRTKKLYQEMGNLMNQAIKDNDCDKALRILNNYSQTICLGDPYEMISEKFGSYILCCNDCDKYFYEDDGYNVEHDYSVCYRCVGNYYWNDSRDCYQEDDPDEEEEETSSLVGSRHSSKRKVSKIPSKFDDRKSQVFLGLELEMEVNSGYINQVAEEIINNIGTYKNYRYCFLEEDGSLNNGIEMVTSWTGLDVHEHQLKFFKDRLKYARSHNTETCGIHVHISKSDMTTLHASKMVLFINDENNLPLIKAIARRESTTYSQLLNKKEDRDWIKQSLKHKNKNYQIMNLNSSRYEALNFYNENTVEFRLFRGSLKYQTIMACLEFTYATWFFCRDSSVNNLTIDQFLQFICLAGNRSDTRHLRAYLTNKGFTMPFTVKPNTKALSTI